MIFLVPFFIGAAVGWMRAGRRGGSTADKLQYGVGHGLALMLVTLVITLVLDQAGYF